MRLAARVLLFAVRVYQTFFSALMPSACKFYPSCSHYAAEALRVHGARRGSWLALRRLSRCHPFTPGGVDLVPGPDEFRRQTNSFLSFRAEREISLFFDLHPGEIPRSARVDKTKTVFPRPIQPYRNEPETGLISTLGIRGASCRAESEARVAGGKARPTGEAHS